MEDASPPRPEGRGFRRVETMTPGASARAAGVVVSVRPRPDGSFAVLIGPGPDLYWYTVWQPPKLGSDASIVGTVLSSQAVRVAGQAGTVTTLGSVGADIVPPVYPRRIVASEWLRRVGAAVRRPLYGYQAEGAGWMAAELAAGRSVILADEQGLGKTVQTIAALCATRMFPAVVSCPASVKINWQRELAWARSPPSSEIVRGRTGPISGADVIILNHDVLQARGEQLGNIHPRVIVLDEAQAFKHPRPERTHRAAVATALAHSIGRSVQLTGTPVFNRPRDLWRLLHIADEREWPGFTLFDLRYCRQQPDTTDYWARRQRRVVTGYGQVANLDELHARADPILLRRLKTQVLPDLPPKSRRRLFVELDELDMATYQQAESDIIAWLRAQNFGDQRVRAATRAEAIVRFTLLRHLAAHGKMRRAVPDYLEQWFDREVVEPLVIYAYHRDVVLSLYHECTRLLGTRVAIIGSGDTLARRQAAIDAFNHGNADVFIAPIGCGGLGINLQERASDVLFVERLWEPTRLTQAEDRLHRIGQMQPVIATYLDAAGTIDEYIAELNEAKQELIAGLLDDGEAAVELVEGTDALIDRLRRTG